MITELIIFPTPSSPSLFDHLKDFFAMAGNLGSVACAVIALLAYFYAKKEILNYLKEQRYDAILKLAHKIEGSNNYIIEIINRTNLYQHEGFYPFHIPEFAEDKHKKLHPERPYRLIFNEINRCKQSASKLILQIHGYEEALQEIISDFNQITNDIQGLMGGQNFPDPKAIEEAFGSFTIHADRLTEITKKVKTVLNKITDEYQKYVFRF